MGRRRRGNAARRRGRGRRSLSLLIASNIFMFSCFVLGHSHDIGCTNKEISSAAPEAATDSISLPPLSLPTAEPSGWSGCQQALPRRPASPRLILKSFQSAEHLPPPWFRVHTGFNMSARLLMHPPMLTPLSIGAEAIDNQTNRRLFNNPRPTRPAVKYTRNHATEQVAKTFTPRAPT